MTQRRCYECARWANAKHSEQNETGTWAIFCGKKQVWVQAMCHCEEGEWNIRAEKEKHGGRT